MPSATELPTDTPKKRMGMGAKILLILGLNLGLLLFTTEVIVYHTINDARCTLYKNTAKHDNTHWRAVWPIYSPTPTEKLLENSMTYLIYRRYMTDYISGMGDMGEWGGAWTTIPMPETSTQRATRQRLAFRVSSVT